MVQALHDARALMPLGRYPAGHVDPPPRVHLVRELLHLRVRGQASARRCCSALTPVGLLLPGSTKLQLPTARLRGQPALGGVQKQLSSRRAALHQNMHAKSKQVCRLTAIHAQHDGWDFAAAGFSDKASKQRKRTSSMTAVYSPLLAE